MKKKQKPGNKAIRLACWGLIALSVVWLATWWLAGAFVTLNSPFHCCWSGVNGTQDPSINPISYAVQTTPVAIMFFLLILLSASYLKLPWAEQWINNRYRQVDRIKELWENL